MSKISEGYRRMRKRRGARYQSNKLNRDLARQLLELRIKRDLLLEAARIGYLGVADSRELISLSNKVRKLERVLSQEKQGG